MSMAKKLIGKVINKIFIAVVSFRNESNGYYGGSMYSSSNDSTEGLVEVTDNWLNN